jgi:hypothetical protein
MIYARNGQQHYQVEFLLKWFENKVRDFVFLVDENMPYPVLDDGSSLLQHVFNRHIEDTDRVSLVKYGKLSQKKMHTKIVFSLCQKQLNLQ